MTAFYITTLITRGYSVSFHMDANGYLAEATSPGKSTMATGATVEAAVSKLADSMKEGA